MKLSPQEWLVVITVACALWYAGGGTMLFLEWRKYHRANHPAHKPSAADRRVMTGASSLNEVRAAEATATHMEALKPPALGETSRGLFQTVQTDWDSLWADARTMIHVPMTVWHHDTPAGPADTGTIPIPVQPADAPAARPNRRRR